MLMIQARTLKGFLYSFKAQHLPPIILSCLLPKTYPSIRSMLDSIWMKQPRQEVLYQWTDWLQKSSLSHLGFDNEIVLCPYGAVTCSRDKRAVSGSCSPDSYIPYIKSYDEGKRRDSFLRDLHECCICFSEYQGKNLFFIYRICLLHYCGLVEFKTLESMTGIAYCPRCGTQCIEDEEQLALCSKCYFSFCTLCNGKRHVGDTCMIPERKLQILQERQGSVDNPNLATFDG